MPEAELVEFERQVFADERRYEETLALEDELLYAYLQRDLTPDDRTLVEQRFLAQPDRSARLAFAAALVHAVEGSRAAKPAVSPRFGERIAVWPRALASRNQFALAASLLVIVATGWLAFRLVGLERQLARIEDAPSAQRRQLTDNIAVARAELDAERRQRVALEQQLADLRQSEPAAPQHQPLIVSLSLVPGLTRGGDRGTHVLVPSSADVVRLDLQLTTADARDLRATVRTAEGAQVWSQGELRSSKANRVSQVRVQIPAPLLVRGDYELTLSAISHDGQTEELATYYVSVATR
jgi:hypothetical protein